MSCFTRSGCSWYFAKSVASMLAGGAPLPADVANAWGSAGAASASFFFTSSLFSLMLVFGVLAPVLARGVAAGCSSSDEVFLRLGVLFGLGVAVASSSSLDGLRLLGVLFATGFVSSSSTAAFFFA